MKIAIVNLSSIEDLKYTLDNLDFLYDEILDPQIDIFIQREHNSYFEEKETKYNIQTLLLNDINIFDLKLKYDNIRYYSKTNYDIAVDTQGTLKSSIVTYLLAGRTAGPIYSGIKAKIISLFYDETINVTKLSNKHDITKQILSKPFGYEIDA